ncbi:MAG TPA: VCBS repeat-containing protein [Bacteroidales bacterium]|nr:RNA-binding protein [Bacteroidales bacterium]HNR43393.1 VCBS repeat-containing protein [Bacteroidales bacterium]HPM19376.1 VCBS repeat-containing protein [Bacteroidales bacterium]HQG78709.1 VCBS repeat-containing protein [Bacteroidales bacterium]
MKRPALSFYSGKYKVALLKWLWLIILVIATSGGKDIKLFKPVPASKSGITFKNVITENVHHNALTHENLYNGGGVAVGDINNDGLDDIFFISNMGYNKLYLNLGNFKFRDITDIAGVAGRPGWKTGVTMVDINGDNLLDIYVCYCTKETVEGRRNELYINHGDLKFTEEAAKWGIDVPTYSTLGAFFDYDLDGDLDMFLVATNTKVLRGMEFESARVDDDPYAGDKLFRNDGDHFTEVTSQAGIISTGIGYGLGIAIADINKDGWPDIYITNDYIEPDYLYINNGDGTFTNRMTEHVLHNSQSAMGNEINDFNNDTWPDIITADMLSEDNRRLKLLYGQENYLEYALQVMQGFYHSTMRNMLQLNNANGTFSEIGQLACVSNTDWSWAPPFADFDNDGWKDLFVTNGYFRDYTDRDFLKMKNDYYLEKSKTKEPADTFWLTSFMTSTPVHNYIFKNNKDLTFTDKSKVWGFAKKGFSNGAAYSDLDNDGDLDLIVSNQNETASIFRNMIREHNPKANYISIRLKGPGKNTAGLCSKIYLYTKYGVQYQEQMPSRGYQSCVTTQLHFGLADAEIIDSIRVEWPGGNVNLLTEVGVNQIITIEWHDQNRRFIPEPPPERLFIPVESIVPYEHTEYGSNDFSRQPLLTSMLSPVGPVMATADVNGDGLTDIYVGGTIESPGKLFIQGDDGYFRPSRFFNFPEDLNCTDGDAVFFDADNDGDQDLYIASGGYHEYDVRDRALQDRLYINDGTGKFKKAAGALPPMLTSKSCVRPVDIDKDGDIDLFVGGWVMPGEYPLPQESFILLNDGNGKFVNAAPAMIPALSKGGMITDAAWADINNDSWPDLITVGEFMPIRVFLNDNGKILREATKTWFDVPETGFWNKITVCDFDHDGNPDFIAGNFGLNSQLKASVKEPIELYFKDFDNNGTIDPIITYYILGQSYPFPSRNEFLTQMPSMRNKFPTYASYADAKLTDIFSPEDLQSATKYTATELRTLVFKNTGSKFVKSLLPMEAQFAPVYAIEILDYNNDGNEDIILAGNKNAMCVRLGVMDASYGQLFEGDGKGNFKFVPQPVSGLNMVGDVRSLKVLTIKDHQFLLAGINNIGIVTYFLDNTSSGKTSGVSTRPKQP